MEPNIWIVGPLIDGRFDEGAFSTEDAAKAYADKNGRGEAWLLALVIDKPGYGYSWTNCDPAA